MNKENNSIEGTKVLSITDANGIHHEFISEAEGETVSRKLKYYMWLSRLFIFFATISLVFFTFTSLVLFRLSPRVSIEPFLIIRQADSKGMVRYEPIAQDMASKNKLMEIFLKQYIMLRNTIINDEVEMRTRWFPGGMVNYLSAPMVFDEFEGSSPENLEKTLARGVVREVEIISLGKLGGEKSNTWKVDFKTYELSEDRRDAGSKALVLRERYWTASITALFIPGRMFMGLRLMNPLGFTVTRYSQTEVNIY